MSWDESLRWHAFWILDRIKGGHVYRYYKENKEAWKRGSSMEKSQKKISRLIEHAVLTTEFYKDFPRDTDLRKLPIVDKETFRNHYQDFQSSLYKEAKDNRLMSTSGSTGTPLCMIQNKDKIAHNTADGIFLGRVGGYKIGMKEAFIRVWVNNVKKSPFRLFQENLIMMDSSSLSDASMKKMLDIIRKKKVKCLIGYSSALAELSRFIDEQGMDTSSFCIKSVIPISESMPAKVRGRLKEQFACPVRAWYSNEENGIMGIQNEEDEGYRINTESFYYEILKFDSDEPAREGELGRLVITDLYNYAFPILRYDNGDTAIARYVKDKGRYKLYLKELYGRRSDMIYDCYGNPLTPYIITNNLWDIKGLKQYRFIQETASDYLLCLNGKKEELDLEDIVGRIAPYLGDKANLRVEFVDEIPVLRSGKRKYIENLWKK